ncbi:GPBP1 protein, partial [Heliornis fulica]|nr:GPBP1 protein [Heliornis fulica]
QSSPTFEKHYENFLQAENRYEANRRRHNSSDGIGPKPGWCNEGHFGKKEKNYLHSYGRHSTENVNHRWGYRGGGSCSHNSTSRCGKGQGLHDTNVPDHETVKKEDKVPKQFKAEDFPSLTPKCEMEPKQNKSLSAGVWEYPLNSTSRSQRMLVIKKGSTKELQVPGVPVVGSLYSQPVKSGSGTSVYKGLVPKLVTPPAKFTQWKSQAKENKLRNPFPYGSASDVGHISPSKSIAKASAVSVKEHCQSNSSSPFDKVGQSFLIKLTKMRSHKKSEFLKEMKQDGVEEEHKDENHSGQDKDESSDLQNSNSSHDERHTTQNFENENMQENGNTSVTSQEVNESSFFHQTNILSSSIEAELRLLKEMGWKEDIENDEKYAPLTEEEVMEFQVIRERLQKIGLRKNGILKNGLIRDFKFNPWKNSTFTPSLENEDSETSSSDTSDDD